MYNGSRTKKSTSLYLLQKEAAMIIKKCIKCGNQFSYKEKFLSSFPVDKSIVCHVCGTKYQVSVLGRLFFGIILVLPMSIKIYFPGIFHDGLINVLLGLVYLAILSFIYPFFELLKVEAVDATEAGKWKFWSKINHIMWHSQIFYRYSY